MSDIAPYRRAWSGILTELAIVVIGILIAFSIDAWWEGVRERAEGRRVAAGIRTELVANQAETDEALEALGRVAAAIDRWLGADGAGPIPPDSLYPVLSAAATFRTLDLVSGNLQSAIASGTLDVVQPAELRADLVDWQTWIQDLEEEKSWFVAQVWELQGAYKTRGVATLDYAYGRNLDDAASDLVGPPPAWVVKLHEDTDFAQAMVGKALALSFYLDEMRDLRTRMDEVIAELDQAVAR